MSIQPTKHDRTSAERLAVSAEEAFARMSDRDLLDAWTRDAHRDALAVLVQRYSRMVLSVCRRRCRTTSDVDDAYQSTFLYLAHHGHKIRSAEKLPGWLHRVAQRTATATLRLNKPETTLMVEPHDSPCEPLQRITQQHDAIVLDEELANLPESYRSVIVMQVNEDCSLEHLAEHFQTTIGAIRGRLHRGKKLLAKRVRRRGVMPVLAFAAATGSMATASQASAAAKSMLTLAQSTTIPAPSVEITPLETLFSPGNQFMTVFNTVAGVLAVGTISALIISFPSSNAGETVTIPNEMNSQVITPQIDGQFGGGGKDPNDPAKSASNTTTVLKPVPLKPTTKLAKKIQSMMGDDVELLVDGTVGDFAQTMQKQLGVPVLLDHRGIKFANQTSVAKVTYSATGEPLQTSLRRMLSPLGLKAVVEDEGLVVTANPEILVHQGIGVSRWVNVNDERAKKIAEALQKVTSVDFDQLPLREAIEEISAAMNIAVQIDQRAMEELGLTADTPVTAKIANLPARDVLQTILGKMDLTYSISGNSLTITTWEASEEQLLTRFYWLEGIGLNDDFDSLMQLIQQIVTPDTWEALGGPSTMQPYPGVRPTLAVSTTYRVHEEVESLLSTLRENSFGPKQTLQPVQIPKKNAPQPGGGGFF